MALSGSRYAYEPIGEGPEGVGDSVPGTYYGSVYQAAETLPGLDVEAPAPSAGVRITQGVSPHGSSSGRRYIWWLAVPAVAMVLTAGVALHFRGSPSVRSDHAEQADETEEPRFGAPVMVWGRARASESALDVNNATLVLKCLEDKCTPLVTQLGKAWRDIANINLLRCLAGAASNKTSAAICFKAAGPSELRDDLVACAGCNKCVQLNDQASVDRACAKYDSWRRNKGGAATSTDLNVVVPPTTPLPAAGLDQDMALALTPGPHEVDDAWSFSRGHQGDRHRAQAPDGEGDAQQGQRMPVLGDGALAHNLPSSLWGRYCSRFWCA